MLGLLQVDIMHHFCRFTALRRDRMIATQTTTSSTVTTRTTVSESTSGSHLALDHIHQLLHGGGALGQRRFLVRSQLDLVDLFDALRAQLHRHADEQAVNTVFAFEQ